MDVHIRYKDIDMLRGCLILCVVLGHMGFCADVMYWFHMPAFFVLGGMLYKSYSTLSLGETIKKVICLYYIPYWGYFIVCRFYRIKIFLGGGMIEFGKEMIKSFYGGSVAADTVAWYPTCLMFVIVLYRALEKNKYKNLIIVLCYLGARIEGWLIREKQIQFVCFWGADICLFAILFYWIGENWKERIVSFRNWNKMKIFLLWVFMVFVCCILVRLGKNRIVNLGVNMKYLEYNDLFGGVVVPIIFFFMLWLGNILVCKIKLISNVLSVIGKNSIAIMWLHMPILDVLARIPLLDQCRIFKFLMVVVGSICFSYIVKKNKYTNIIFFGYRSKSNNL